LGKVLSLRRDYRFRNISEGSKDLSPDSECAPFKKRAKFLYRNGFFVDEPVARFTYDKYILLALLWIRIGLLWTGQETMEREQVAGQILAAEFTGTLHCPFDPVFLSGRYTVAPRLGHIIPLFPAGELPCLRFKRFPDGHPARLPVVDLKEKRTARNRCDQNATHKRLFRNLNSAVRQIGLYHNEFLTRQENPGMRIYAREVLGSHPVNHSGSG
jgi:hypothetical protein